MMKIKILQKCYPGIEGRNFWPGETMDIDERMARTMIERGDAKVLKQKKKPLRNRAIPASKIDTPES